MAVRSAPRVRLLEANHGFIIQALTVWGWQTLAVTTWWREAHRLFDQLAANL